MQRFPSPLFGLMAACLMAKAGKEGSELPGGATTEASTSAPAPADTTAQGAPATDSASTSTKPAKTKTEVTTVKMDDGRVVDFPGKRRVQKEAFQTGEGPDAKVSVRLDFINGETRTWTIPSIDMLLRCAAHGASQKLGDEIAGVKDIEDAVLAIDDLMDRLNEGKWEVQSDKSGLAGASLLVKAMVEVMNKPADVIKAFLKTKTPAEKAALRNTAKLKPVIERMEAEKAEKQQKAGKTVDTDALLGELDALA